MCAVSAVHGYPMTFQRVIRRNHLSKGDYEDVPFEWAVNVNMAEKDDNIPEIAAIRRQALERYRNMVRMLLGDLRRLEHDAQDERTICLYIAARTGIDTSLVAAVLKEFINW